MQLACHAPRQVSYTNSLCIMTNPNNLYQLFTPKVYKVQTSTLLLTAVHVAKYIVTLANETLRERGCEDRLHGWRRLM